jgi:hypothetical protein
MNQSKVFAQINANVFNAILFVNHFLLINVSYIFQDIFNQAQHSKHF